MMRLREIGQWSRKSLRNQIVLCEVVLAAPTFLIFCVANYFEGTLTVSWALWILVVAFCEGIAFAVPTWYVFVALRTKANDDTRNKLARKRDIDH